jgi:hypothetical protein
MANTELWWKCSWQGKTAVLGGNLSHYRVVHNKYHTDCLSIEPRPPQCEAPWAVVMTNESYVANKYMFIYVNNRLQIAFRATHVLKHQKDVCVFVWTSTRFSSEFANLCTTETPRSKNSKLFSRLTELIPDGARRSSLLQCF